MVLLLTLNPLWVSGEGVLRCIATALRGLGHQFRREMVRSSDKFVEQQYGNIIMRPSLKVRPLAS